jgi:hypothetical protein
MSEKKNPAAQGKPDLRPEAQTDESQGSVKGRQVTDDTVEKVDVQKGAEMSAGRGGIGAHHPKRYR